MYDILSLCTSIVIFEVNINPEIHPSHSINETSKPEASQATCSHLKWPWIAQHLQSCLLSRQCSCWRVVGCVQN